MPLSTSQFGRDRCLAARRLWGDRWPWNSPSTARREPVKSQAASSWKLRTPKGLRTPSVPRATGTQGHWADPVVAVGVAHRVQTIKQLGVIHVNSNLCTCTTSSRHHDVRNDQSANIRVSWVQFIPKSAIQRFSAGGVLMTRVVTAAVRGNDIREQMYRAERSWLTKSCLYERPLRRSVFG